MLESNFIPLFKVQNFHWNWNFTPDGLAKEHMPIVEPHCI